MDPLASILDIVKYVVPALVVLITSYTIVQKFLVTEMQRKQIAMFRETQDVTLRLRLQAYERMVVFVERISARQLLGRVYDSGMTVKDLQLAMVLTIKSEFEHNLSQQIYVSQNVWETVKGVKEQEINMANQLSKTLNPDAPAKELYGRITDMLLSTEETLPTDMALQVINEEARRVLSLERI